MAARYVFRSAALLLVLLMLAIAPVTSQSVPASVTASGEVPEWALDSPMHLSLSMDGDTLSQEFTVIPLTRNIGANGSDPTLAVRPARTLLHHHMILLPTNSPRARISISRDELYWLSLLRTPTLPGATI
jgi:hypothetical protein